MPVKFHATQALRVPPGTEYVVPPSEWGCCCVVHRGKSYSEICRSTRSAKTVTCQAHRRREKAAREWLAANCGKGVVLCTDG